MQVQPQDALPKIMFARYYYTGHGRFLSVDPGRGGVTPNLTGTWNLFSYVLNNPMQLVDPTGKAPTVTFDDNVGVTVRAATQSYINTSRMQDLPSTFQIHVVDMVAEYKGEGPKGSKYMLGETIPDVEVVDGKAVAKGATVAVASTLPDGTDIPAVTQEETTGHEMGHVVDVFNHPEEALHPEERTEEEVREDEEDAEENKEEMDEEIEDKEADQDQELDETIERLETISHLGGGG